MWTHEPYEDDCWEMNIWSTTFYCDGKNSYSLSIIQAICDTKKRYFWMMSMYVYGGARSELNLQEEVSELLQLTICCNWTLLHDGGAENLHTNPHLLPLPTRYFYFGQILSICRVILFVKHTKAGNPVVAFMNLKTLEGAGFLSDGITLFSDDAYFHQSYVDTLYQINVGSNNDNAKDAHSFISYRHK